MSVFSVISARSASLVAAVVFASSVSAFQEDCADIDVSIGAKDRQTFDLACSAAQRAIARLAAVKLTQLRHITILVVPEADDLQHGPVASYHPGKRIITILEPDKLSSSVSKTSAFSRLDTSEHFAGLVAHEMAHVALDDIYGRTSPAIAHEYVAYALQIDTLDSPNRDKFLAGVDFEAVPSYEYLNGWTLTLSPDLFAAHAWNHFKSGDVDADAVDAAMHGRVPLSDEISP